MGKRSDASLSGDKNLEDLVTPRLRHLILKSDTHWDNCLHELVIDSIERPLLQLVLARTRGNQVQASQILGINRNTLRKKIQHLNIDLNKAKKGKV